MLITILKFLFILIVLFIMAYPFLPLPFKFRRFSTLYKLRYPFPENKRNIWFVLLSIVYISVLASLSDIYHTFIEWIYQFEFMNKLLSKTLKFLGSQVNFIAFVVVSILLNILCVYVFLLIKAILKRLIPEVDPEKKAAKEKKKKEKAEKKRKAKEAKKKKGIFGFFKKKDEADDSKNNPVEKTEDEPEIDDDSKNYRVAYFEHSKDESETDKETEDKEEEYNKQKKNEEKIPLGTLIKEFVLGLFFEGDKFQYARSWLIRVRKILQGFVYILGVTYLVLFFVLLFSLVYTMPKVLYTFLIDVLHVQYWYIYPFLAMIVFQEFCNFADAPPFPREAFERNKNDDETILEDKEARLSELRAELSKRFDADHYLRYYPALTSENEVEYKCTNVAYGSALEYIRRNMKESSGRVVKSYLECLDAMFNDNHVYFAASYYSEFGEYMAAYTYIRLLSGARMIFITSDVSEKNTLKTHIGERLMALTGSSPNCTWRICTSDERLDQADILIATPADFADDDMIEKYPGFFDEVCNAVFIDADKMVVFDSYLCLVMASRLLKATANRIIFTFLSLDMLKGFASATLPKFFCVDKVLSFSSASENEEVEYSLWNKESKNHRIYDKNGQVLTGLESIIAELACEYDVDGVRVMTQAPISHADKKMLALHGVEINNMYRPVSDFNYMIYSDDRCNLPAAIYACTRFRGKKRSVVNILCKPYMLREYFMSKAVSERYINRSSFIKPRVTEHAERHKISLLRIFCDATDAKGIPVSVFENNVRAAIHNAVERDDVISSAYCRKIISEWNIELLTYKELAGYLIAGLFDRENCSVELSAAQGVKDFYLIIEPYKNNGFNVVNEKHIVFSRVKEVFERLFECNQKVVICLNDTILGTIDTFPTRTHLEYIAGQSIIYDNTEYEIEHISDNGAYIFLRRENSKIRNCLDTVHLRRYDIKNIEFKGKTGVLHSTKTLLEEIRVTRSRIEYIGETYGFYSITTDRQTIDFYCGAEGNPHVKERNIRNMKEGKALHVEISCRMECNDGMRMLLSAVFNEFIKTIFPHAYHCIAIVPILAEKLPFDDENEAITEIDRIRTLYPYIKSASEAFTETDSKKMRFLFINDCSEDVGVTDWFYDLSAFYMQEFLANVYSYLHWLQKHEDKQQYIYFGGESLPECYDLVNLCELFKGFNWRLSDDGQKDFETANDVDVEEEEKRCAFCHKVVESGRYERFDNHRYICVECFNTVSDKKLLVKLYKKVREYLEKNYSEIKFGEASVEIDSLYSLEENQVLSEYYYKLNELNRIISVERDNPETNVEVSILRGIIELWQTDNKLSVPQSKAQVYYEELLYLRSLEKHESAKWIYNALPNSIRDIIDEIDIYINGTTTMKNDYVEKEVDEDSSEIHSEDEISDEAIENGSADDTGNSDTEGAESNISPNAGEDDESNDKSAANSTVKKTSFSFLVASTEEPESNEYDDDFGEDIDDKLYHPDMLPRFWKRYLKKQRIDNEEEEDVSKAETEEDIEENAEEKVKNDDTDKSKVVVDESENTVDTEEKNTDSTDEQPAESGDMNDSSNSNDAKDAKEAKNSKESKNSETKKKKKSWMFWKKPSGEEIVPYEEEEKINPEIRFYNELTRACFDYSEEPISIVGLSSAAVQRIYYFVICDFPELFWVEGYKYSATSLYVNYRCKDAYGKIDIRQIEKKRKELRKAAKPFIKGISKKTDPYEAFLKIYRRLILTLDYDGRGLAMGNGKDLTKDDNLRSLYSALVEHKVVCAGYAVAMQYLAQSIGLVCGHVISEDDACGTSCHAFNMIKIGKGVYYVDPTWGDSSNTNTGSENSDLVQYNYCCVPYNEFVMAPQSDVCFHMPRHDIFPDSIKQIAYTNHEYFRYNKAYFTSYDINLIVDAFVRAAENYDKREMGRFSVGLRFSNLPLREHVKDKLCTHKAIHNVVEMATQKLSKNRHRKLLEGTVAVSAPQNVPVLYFYFDEE